MGLCLDKEGKKLKTFLVNLQVDLQGSVLETWEPSE